MNHTIYTNVVYMLYIVVNDTVFDIYRIYILQNVKCSVETN